MSDKQILIYGAYGYTGRLIVAEALRHGLRPVLAGRNPDRLAALARQTGLETRVFGLDHPAELDAGLADVALVAHAAGPFRETSRQMVEACLRGGRHYLDITGEIPVIEAAAARHQEAQARGVVLMPAVGMDVVPSDCLAVYLARKLPSATQLRIAFRSGGPPSRGTTRTALGHLGYGGVIRRSGKLERVPHAFETRRIDFGKGEVETVSIPWGDLATAFRSTGIPDITAFAAFSKTQLRLLRGIRAIRPILKSKAGRALLGLYLRSIPEGPTEEERRTRRVHFWAEVEDDRGARAAARLHTPEGYALTALTTVDAARRVLSGEVAPGFQTPGLAFGPDYILQFEGCSREDLT